MWNTVGAVVRIGVIFFVLIVLCRAVQAEQTDLKTVNWVTDNWPGITDGSGLYDQVFAHVFSKQAFKINKTFAPFKRVLRGIDNGRFDFGGGVLKEDAQNKWHIQAPFPVMTNAIQAFGKWSVLETDGLVRNGYKDLTVCVTHLFDDAAKIKGKIYEAHSKQQAFYMVVSGRCDLFIDDERTLREVIKQEGKKIPDFEIRGFGTKEVGRFSAYMISPRNARGAKIMDAYVDGTLEALKEGSLQKIYTQLGFNVPDLLIRYSQIQ
jgi:ABC-type amino acid transport substrate-binding protein